MNIYFISQTYSYTESDLKFFLIFCIIYKAINVYDVLKFIVISLGSHNITSSITRMKKYIDRKMIWNT